MARDRFDALRRVRRGGTVLLASLAFLGCGASAAEPMTVHSFSTAVTKTISYRYLLSLPTGYEAAPDKQWPLLLFLHGAGERGNDIWVVAKHGPPRLLKGGPDLSEAEKQAAAELREKFIVVSPQCPTGQFWDDDGVLALLDDIVARLRVDTGRVYLTGLSMGGYGTWSLAAREPQRFAAVVPICGGGQFIATLLSTPAQKAALQTLGVWAFHGAKDPVVPLDESERMVQVFKRAGTKNIQLTVYPEATHNSWTETYAQPDLYAWLLRHARGPLSP